MASLVFHFGVRLSGMHRLEAREPVEGFRGLDELEPLRAARGFCLEGPSIGKPAFLWCVFKSSRVLFEH